MVDGEVMLMGLRMDISSSLMEEFYNLAVEGPGRDGTTKALITDQLVKLGVPSHDDKEAEELVTSQFIKDYETYRKRGFPLSDVAYVMGITPARMVALLSGQGLSREKHRALIQSEMRCRVMLESDMLEIIEQAARENLNYKAAKELLLLLNPDRYGTQRIQVSGGLGGAEMSSEEKALQAQKELEALRTNRNHFMSGGSNG